MSHRSLVTSSLCRESLPRGCIQHSGPSSVSLSVPSTKSHNKEISLFILFCTISTGFPLHRSKNNRWRAYRDTLPTEQLGRWDSFCCAPTFYLFVAFAGARVQHFVYAHHLTVWGSWSTTAIHRHIIIHRRSFYFLATASIQVFVVCFHLCTFHTLSNCHFSSHLQSSSFPPMSFLGFFPPKSKYYCYYCFPRFFHKSP